MNIKKSAVAAAVAGALALGVSGSANAYVYAVSNISIDNLSIVPTPASAAAITRFDFNLTNTATLNGASAIQTATCGGLPTGQGAGNNCNVAPVLNALPANAPGGTQVRADNALVGGELQFIGPSAGNRYSNSDSVIQTAQLVNGVPTSTRNIAEALLTAGGTNPSTASSSSQIQSITGFTFTFVVTNPTALSFTFNADPDLMASIIGEGGGTYSAQANLNVSITLNQNGGANSFNWNPQGTPGTNDCTVTGTVTCTETGDPLDLNVNVGTTANGTSNPYSFDPGVLNTGAGSLFGINVGGLSAGTYTLTLNEVKSVQLARNVVPEPGMMGLMGLGLAGLFAASRRKKS